MLSAALAPNLPEAARASRLGGKGSLVLAVLGVVGVVIGALGLFLPLIQVGYLGKISFLQGRDLCSNPFGAAVSECSMVTLGFFMSLLFVVLGLIFITVGLIRWGGRGSSGPGSPRVATREPDSTQAPTSSVRRANPAQGVRWQAAGPGPAVAVLGATDAQPIDWGGKVAPILEAGRQTLGRIVQAAVAAGWHASRHFQALDRRIKIGIAVAPIVVVGAAFSVMTLNSPENQISQVAEAVAARQSPAKLLDSGSFADSIGVSRAPAGIAFAVADVKVARDEPSGRYQATWTLTATGNGKSTAANISASFVKIADSFACELVSGSVDVTPLVAPLDSDDAVQTLIASTNAANAALGSTASSMTETVEDASAPIPEPIQVLDDTILAGKPIPVAGKEGVPAQLSNTYLTVGGGRYLVRRVSIPAVPATVVVGTILPSTLTGPAAESLRALTAARVAGDVAEASRHLVNADGLTTSGLAASSIAGVPEAQLTVDGSPGAYFVLLPDGTRMTEGTDGTWRVDYTGQPLQVLTFAQELHYSAPDEAGSDIRVHVKPVSILAGQQQAPIVLTLDVNHEAGDRWYANDYVSINDVSLNGVPVAPTPDFSCPIAGYGPESLTCDLAGLTVPPDGLRSVKLTITLGSWWGGLDQYGSVPFSSAP